MKRIETLSIVHCPPKILLGLKHSRKKFGNKWNGWGGGVEEGETIEGAREREELDEGGITLINSIKCGIILFKFIPDEEHEVHIFKANGYKGELKPSNDFVKYDWFHEREIPFDDMMPADRYWLPYLIKGVPFKGVVYFDNNFQVISHKINEVYNLD